eukprot:jgi/Tetstr1/429167/TSEL_019120.t1
MLSSSPDWPRTALCMPQVWSVLGCGYTLFIISKAAQACARWSSTGLLEPWMLRTLRDTTLELSVITGARQRLVLSLKPHMEARGGIYPDALSKENVDDLATKFSNVNDLLKGAHLKIVDGKSDSLIANLNRQLSDLCTLQARCHRVELEQQVCEMRRVASAAEYKTMLNDISPREALRVSRYLRGFWGIQFATLHHLPPEELTQFLQQVDVPQSFGIPQKMIKVGLKHFRRKIKQPLHDVHDGMRSLNTDLRCCLGFLA